jgi:hypothetical protein
MRVPNEGDVGTVERLIDSVGLYETLSLIEAICAEKADHIRASYADDSTADAWLLAGIKIAEASSSDVVKEVS